MKNPIFSQEEFYKGFKPVLERTSRKEYIWISFLLVLIAFGLVGLIMQITGGHEVTGMRDNVVWGIYIVTFIYMLGLSYSGALVGGAMFLMKTKWRGPIMRILEFITIFPLFVGPLFIIFCIGRLDRLHYLFLYPRIQSPITWDVIAIITDIIGCGLFIYLALLRDFMRLRDLKEIKLPKWKRNLYTRLSLHYHNTELQEKLLKRTKVVMAAMVIAIAITVYSILAWLFSVTLQPGWHSTIFGPYFVVAAIFSGTAFLIFLMYIYRKVYKLEKFITKKHFVNVGVIMLIAALFFGYFTFSEYLTKWYGNESGHSMVISKLFKEYSWHFIVAHYLPVLVPAVIIGIPRFRTIKSITFSAVVVLVGLWLHRYLIVVPSLETPYIPIQDSREAFVHYSATWVEWSLVIAGFAAIALLFTLANKFVPIIDIDQFPQEEIEESSELSTNKN